MEAIVATGLAALVGGGIYLALRERSFSLVLGLTLLSYAANLFLFASGRLGRAEAPLVIGEAERYADPLPQALVLTAIVIGFGMIAYLIALALRAVGETGGDHVDGGVDGGADGGGEERR